MIYATGTGNILFNLVISHVIQDHLLTRVDTLHHDLQDTTELRDRMERRSEEEMSTLQNKFETRIRQVMDSGSDKNNRR